MDKGIEKIQEIKEITKELESLKTSFKLLNQEEDKHLFNHLESWFRNLNSAIEAIETSFTNYTTETQKKWEDQRKKESD